MFGEGDKFLRGASAPLRMYSLFDYPINGREASRGGCAPCYRGYKIKM
jgi:hypothetical protein